jgi:hypothetical protein
MPKVFLQFRLLSATWHDASDGMNDSPSATTAIIAVKLVNFNLYFPYFATDNLKYNTEYRRSVSAPSGQASNTVSIYGRKLPGSYLTGLTNYPLSISLFISAYFADERLVPS